MPAAPLAKGLIITLSLLCAAGLAVYENPQVRSWVDESRRKVAMALYSLGDEFHPMSEEHREGRTQQDASTREDESPEAVERRRRARQEILERGRSVQEARRAKARGKGSKPGSFDDIVDEHGALRPDKQAEATTSAAEHQVDQSGLRHRAAEKSSAAALGASLANPFSDEMYMEPESHQPTGHSTPTRLTSPPIPPKPEAYQPQRFLADDVSGVPTPSHHSSEQLIDYTPTTSAPMSPSSAAADLAELTDSGPRDPVRVASASAYWSTNASVSEWAMQNSGPAAFYSPPQTGQPAAGPEQDELEKAMSEMMEGSQAGSGYHASQDGSEDMDVFSEDGIKTPGTWTEVGSQVSEDL